MKLRVCVAGVTGILTMALIASGESGGSKSGVRLNLDEPAASAGVTPPRKAAPAQKAAGTTTSSTATKSGAAKTSPAKSAKKAKDEPPPKIEGMEVARGDKGFLGIKVAGGFKVSFYGPDKKPIAADVSQIVLRWPVHYQPNDERALLTPSGDGTVMTSEKIVRPPYRFKLYITLLKSAEDPSPETYVVDFAQP